MLGRQTQVVRLSPERLDLTNSETIKSSLNLPSEKWLSFTAEKVIKKGSKIGVLNVANK